MVTEQHLRSIFGRPQPKRVGDGVAPPFAEIIASLIRDRPDFEWLLRNDWDEGYFAHVHDPDFTESYCTYAKTPEWALWNAYLMAMGLEIETAEAGC